MTKLEQQGYAVAAVLLRGYPRGNEQIDWMEVRTLLSQAYVCGAKANEKQDTKPQSKQLLENIRMILNCLNELTGRHFRENSANIAIIKARLQEPEVTVNGIVTMMERQCKKWKGTDMEEYLRPSTLFRASKFDNYYAARDLPIHIEDKKRKRFGTLNYESD